MSTCFTARDALARYDELSLAGATIAAICDDGRQVTVSELRSQVMPGYIPRVPPLSGGVKR